MAVIALGLFRTQVCICHHGWALEGWRTVPVFLMSTLASILLKSATSTRATTCLQLLPSWQSGDHSHKLTMNGKGDNCASPFWMGHAFFFSCVTVLNDLHQFRHEWGETVPYAVTPFPSPMFCPFFLPLHLSSFHVLPTQSHMRWWQGLQPQLVTVLCIAVPTSGLSNHVCTVALQPQAAYMVWFVD